MKTKKKILLILIIIIFILFSIALPTSVYIYLKYFSINTSYSSKVTKENSQFVQNPYQGFYHLYGFSLTDDNTDKAAALSDTIINDNYSLALLEINLKNFNSQNLSDNALSQLETLLSSCEASDKKLIIRFLYDWDGKALETEPDSIEQIFSHMDQISPYINNYKNTVYILQGIFAGNCGEMNNSKYMSHENMTALINHLNSCIDSSIFLSVRTPAQWRIINNCTMDNLSDTLTKNPIASRLGLFNDGLLASDIDLGTYGVSSFEGTENPADKGTRNEEILFQNILCSITPNGGECVIDNPYNDLDNAINDFYSMHISYLNCDYDAEVLNKWKNTAYSGNNAFDGTDGYSYIESHLGYRYVVTDSSIEAATDNFLSMLHQIKGHDITLNFTLENRGFAPSYRQFSSEIIVINSNDNSSMSLPVEFDNRKLDSNSSVTLSVKIDTSQIEMGSYKLYYSMTDSSSAANSKIAFANENYSDSEPGVMLGILDIQ